PLASRREQLHAMVASNASSSHASSSTSSSSLSTSSLSIERKRKRSPHDRGDEWCTIIAQRIKTNNWPAFYRNHRLVSPEQHEGTKLYCYCKRPNFGEMVRCDDCKEWFHFPCINMDTAPKSKRFCPSCLGLFEDPLM